MSKQEIKDRIEELEQQIADVKKSTIQGEHLQLVQINLRLEQLVLFHRLSLS